MTHRIRLSWRTRVGLTGLLAATTVTVSAQAPQRRGPRVDMQIVAESLGVQCEYCHAAGQVTDAGRTLKDPR